MSKFNREKRKSHKYFKGDTHHPINIRVAWFMNKQPEFISRFIKSEEYLHTSKEVKIVVDKLKSKNEEIELLNGAV